MTELNHFCFRLLLILQNNFVFNDLLQDTSYLYVNYKYVIMSIHIYNPLCEW